MGMLGQGPGAPPPLQPEAQLAQLAEGEDEEEQRDEGSQQRGRGTAPFPGLLYLSISISMSCLPPSVPPWSPGLCERAGAKRRGRAGAPACPAPLLLLLLPYCVVKEPGLGGLNRGQALHFSFLTWQPFRETLLSAIS